MKTLFYKGDPRLSDYVGFGIFLATYLAVLGFVFSPWLSSGDRVRGVMEPARNIELQIQDR